jgi:hypothetical protein
LALLAAFASFAFVKARGAPEPGESRADDNS